MRTRLSPRSFGGGELAPWLDGISSEVTAKGCRTLENFVVMKQGPITRRPGTFYVNEVKDSTDDHPVLVPVTIDDSNSYVLELGDAYVRFYKNHVQVSLAAAAYEVTTPWSIGEVANLRWCYVPDDKAVYFTHPEHAMRKLAWTSDASWAMNVVSFISGKGLRFSDASGKGLVTDNFSDWRISYALRDGVECFGKNTFVSYGYDGLIVSTATSDDGTEWIKSTFGYLIPGLESRIISAHSDGTIVALTNGSVALVSHDDWFSPQAVVMPNSNGYNCVNVDETINRWRAFGSNFAYSDSSGVTWYSVAPIAGVVTFSDCVGHDDTWVAVAGARIYSANSITAAELVFSITGHIFDVVSYGEYAGTPTWIALARNTSTYTEVMYVSNNRTTWSASFSVSRTANRQNRGLINYRNSFYYFDWNAGIYHSSDDGRTWQSHTINATLGKVHMGGERYPVADLNPDYEWFDTSNHYPRLAAVHEGRLVVGPTDNEPATLWGSKINAFNNFYLGEFSDEAWSYKLASDRNVDIQWIMGGMGGLAVGTRTGEGVLMGSEAEGITPNTAQFKWQSTFGSNNVQPVRVHDYIIFAQRGGEIIRGYVPGAGAQAYKSPDLTAYADHIAEGGVHEFDHQDDPQTIVYAVRSDGTLLALTFEDNTIAWSRIVTDGSFESVAVIPTAGAEDEVWCVVKRTIGAATKRYIEYFDTLKVSSALAAHYVDCGYENAAAASATVFAEVMPQLAGESIDVLVNGNIVEHARTVSASGTFTIANAAATHIHAGLPCPAYAQTMRLETSSPWGSGMGLSKRNANLLVWVHDTIGGEFGPEVSITEAVAFSAASPLTTDLLEVNFPGTWDRDGYIWCIQRDPLPMTIVAVAPDIEVGDK